MSLVTIPEGWRKLNDDDVIALGDKYINHALGEFVDCTEFLGTNCTNRFVLHIRKKVTVFISQETFE